MSHDYTVGDTIYFKFTTRAFATGIPTVLAGTPVLSAYEDASVTQITAGVSITADLDGVAGLNLATIVATGGNGFESGKHYGIVITTGTVGGDSVVGEVIGQFTLEKSAAAVDLANATDGLGAIKTETALIVADTGELQTDWVNGGRLDNILDARMAEASIDTTAGAVDTVTTNTDMRGTDSAALASVCTEPRLAELDAGNLPTDVAANATPAEVLTQVNAALDTAMAELGQAQPSATPTLRTGIMLMYMALRNQLDVQTSGTDALEIRNAAGTIIAKKLLTDDGSDYSEALMVTGP